LSQSKTKLISKKGLKKKKKKKTKKKKKNPQTNESCTPFSARSVLAHRVS
jgi:hypothetical protein